jgi:ribonuclease P protein component
VGAGSALAASQEGAKKADVAGPLETRGSLTTSEGFPRRQRLKRATDFRLVLGRGKRFRAACLEIMWAINDVGHPRLGLVVPKFQSSAVARNRLRRRLKEVTRRLGLPRLGPVDVVIRIRREAYGAGWDELSQAVRDWLMVAQRAP